MSSTQPAQTAGQHPGFNTPSGANSGHHDTPTYTDEAYADHSIRPATITEPLHAKYPNFYYNYNFLQTPTDNANEDNNEGDGSNAAMLDDDGFYMDDDDNSYINDLRADAVEAQCLIRLKQFVNGLDFGYY